MDILIGTQIANYRVDAQLGQGGMARVYRGYDVTLNRPVAIKVIDAALSGQDRYRERFEREAQSIASLEHPNIVPVYYFGKTESLYFLVMKFIEGEDLSALMTRYALADEYMPANDVLRIIEAVGSALDYAHRKGVIHRDVKPGNVLIDRDGHVYLSDFGLALNLQQGSMGEAFGTPHYMSPEQAMGSTRVVPQSDLYSLGVMLYELMAGVVPFDDPNPTAVAFQHVNMQPTPPRAWNHDLLPAVEQVILKLLAKTPAERYASGAELTAALRAALQNAGDARTGMEIPALPPLPLGVDPLPPRRPSMRTVSAEVRASLASRARPPSTVAGSPPPIPLSGGTQPMRAGTMPAAAPAGAPVTVPAAPPASGGVPLPLLVLGSVMLGVLLIVLVVALVLNGGTPSAALPTLNASATPLPASDTPTDVPPSQTPVPVVVVATDVLPTATNTELPPTATPLPPTATPTTTFTPLPPTATPALGATPVPADWLPVRFIYDASAFWWQNLSTASLRVSRIVFERLDGTSRFDGARWSQFFGRVESGGCVRLNAPNVTAGPAALAGCRVLNVDMNAASAEGFWLAAGAFRVLWDGVEIALCDTSVGQCDVAVPPG